MARRRVPHQLPPQRSSALTDPDLKDVKARAIAAVSAFQRRIPQLSAFARNMTGNKKTRIAITSQTPYTDGITIYIQPPMELAEGHAHDRSVCGRRAASGRQMCKACQVMEIIDFFVYHEIAHIVGNSHAKANKKTIDDFLYLKADWHPAGVCEHDPEVNQYMTCKEVYSKLNPYIPLILNCFEDTRVNQMMFNSRPGLREVFNVNVERILNEGMEVKTGETITWINQPLDAQFSIGLYLISSGYDVEGYLEPKVLEALADPEIMEICNTVPETTSVFDTGLLATRAFRAAQRLGFCVVPKCEPTPPVPDDFDPSDMGNEESNDGTSGNDPGDESSDSPTDDTSTGQPGDSTDSSVPGESGSADKNDSVDETSGQEGVNDEDDADGNAGGNDESADPPGSSGSDGEEDEGDRADEDADGGSSSSSDESDRSGESGGTGDERGGEQDGDSNGHGDLDSSSDTAGSGDDAGDEPVSSSDESTDGDGSDGDFNECDHRDPNESGECVDCGADLSEWYSDADDPWSTPGSDETPAMPTAVDGPSDPVDGQTTGTPNMGDPDEVARAIGRFLMHSDVEDVPGMLDDMAEGDAEDVVGASEHTAMARDEGEIVSAAVMQAGYFESISGEVLGVEIAQYPNVDLLWDASRVRSMEGSSGPADLIRRYQPTESLIGEAVFLARRAFQVNDSSRRITGLKSGKINTRALARKAPAGDPHIFRKKLAPRKRSYAVVLGVDCSGSTSMQERNAKLKRMSFAIGTLLDRVGVPWAGYAHTALHTPLNRVSRNRLDGEYYLYILPFKEANEPWTAKTQERLVAVQALNENLDGHTLEFYRKQVERMQATDRIIIYTTDGAMPAANYEEEEEILRRETARCAKENITLMGVGINTDSPSRFGMDTVRVDSDADIIKVVMHLEQVLAR